MTPSRLRRIGGRKGLLVAAAIAALAAVLVVGLIFGGSRTEPQPLVLDLARPGEAPAVRGSDPLTGRPVSFDQFRGRPLVVNLWASWCEPCKEEAPDIARFVRDHPEVGFVGIDVSDTRRGARRFYERYAWSHPSIWDPDATIAADLGLQALPTTLFLDDRGRIVGRAIRTVTYDDLASAARQMAQ